MPKFAVAAADLFDNLNYIEVIEADNINAAILQHSKVEPTGESKETILDKVEGSTEKLELYFFDMGLLVTAIEI